MVQFTGVYINLVKNGSLSKLGNWLAFIEQNAMFNRFDIETFK